MKLHNIYNGSCDCRVVTCQDEKTIGGYKFEGFGSHHSHYPVPYFTVAAAIGMTTNDVDIFCKKLDKVFSKVYRNESVESLTADTAAS